MSQRRFDRQSARAIRFYEKGIDVRKAGQVLVEPGGIHTLNLASARLTAKNEHVAGSMQCAAKLRRNLCGTTYFHVLGGVFEPALSHPSRRGGNNSPALPGQLVRKAEQRCCLTPCANKRYDIAGFDLNSVSESQGRP